MNHTRTWSIAAVLLAAVGACSSEDSVAPATAGSGGATGMPGTEHGRIDRAPAVDGETGEPGGVSGVPGSAAGGRDAAGPSGPGMQGPQSAVGSGQGPAIPVGESDPQPAAGAGMAASEDPAPVSDVADGLPNTSIGAQDPDCDMNGLWAVRVMSVVEALGLEQCGNLYNFMKLRHEGVDVEVVEDLNCGIEGRGTANSSFSDATVQGMLRMASQVGRRGTMQKGPDGTCEFNMEPIWTVLGADEASYTPSPRNAPLSLAEVQAMLPMPSSGGTGGVIDVEGDGYPGAAFIVTGALSGKRHAAQRNFQAWLTNERYRIEPAIDWPSDIEARADYIGEDVNFETEPPGNPLLAAGANPVRNAASARVTLRFLGRDETDPRAAGLLEGTDAETDPTGAVRTCRSIVDALSPIVPLAFPDPQVCPCPGGGICM